MYRILRITLSDLFFPKKKPCMKAGNINRIYIKVCGIPHSCDFSNWLAIVVNRKLALLLLYYPYAIENEVKIWTLTEYTMVLVSGDDVVAYQHGEKSARILSSSGFQNLTFRNYQGYLYISGFVLFLHRKVHIFAKIFLQVFILPSTGLVTTQFLKRLMKFVAGWLQIWVLGGHEK